MQRFLCANRIAGFFIIAFALCLQPGRASARLGMADTVWPMYQHDTRHTGRSSLLGITAAPKLLWSRQISDRTSGIVGSGMSIGADGTIYVSAFGQLHALDPRDGAPKWTTTNMPSQSYSTPAVAADGRLYWGVGDSITVIAPTGEIVGGLDGLSGNEVSGSAPVIGPDGTVYYTHDALWALSPQGELRWVHPFGSWFAHSSPAIGADGTIYASSGFGEGVFYALAPDGTVKWRGSVATPDGTPSIGDDGTIYVPSVRARLAAYAPDGTLKWLYTTNESASIDATIIGTPSIGSDGSLYFSAATPPSVAVPTAHIYALTRDGALRWKIAVPSAFTGAIALDGMNNLYGCDTGGICYAISDEGQTRWRYTIATDRTVRTIPLLVADNTIWILDELGHLYALAGGQPAIYLPIVTR